ncbi:MAG: hypothetical protein GY861_07285 [bacterium]|nr:hypothetical protein [bacterium]
MRLPGQLARKTEDDKEKLIRQKCIKIKREMVSFTAPKKCVLHITISNALTDIRFIDTIYNYFREKSAVPTKLQMINEKQFDIEIGTDSRRCSDCNSLINRYREFLDGNIIEEKGSCTFEGRKSNFCYEDMFE